MTPKDVIKMAQENKAVMANFKFLDFPGIWQHFAVPISELREEIFEEGLGFDGSSIRGWQAIHTSDMLIIPDATTAFMDPFMEYPTISLICNIVDPITKEKFLRVVMYGGQWSIRDGAVVNVEFEILAEGTVGKKELKLTGCSASDKDANNVPLTPPTNGYIDVQ